MVCKTNMFSNKVKIYRRSQKATSKQRKMPEEAAKRYPFVSFNDGSIITIC